MAAEFGPIWTAGKGDARGFNTWDIHMRTPLARRVVQGVLGKDIATNQTLVVVQGEGQEPLNTVLRIFDALLEAAKSPTLQA